MKDSINYFNRQRRAGVLLHPTSFPGEFANGDLGHQAYRFIEFLNQNGFKVWQMLPLAPTHEDGSPYQCLSSHAGNHLLISLDWLEDKGWLNRELITVSVEDESYRSSCLYQASENFYSHGDTEWINRLIEFQKQHDYWLDDYALFKALKKRNNNSPWYEWPDVERHREAKKMNHLHYELQDVIRQTVFEQFIFFTQWHEIRVYAKQHDIELFGDIPIFVALDSADVWARKKNFLIDDDGEMEFVSGVPPDAFSKNGQRWGNPLYDWQYMQSTEYEWWKQRLHTQLELFDMVRIDHFRGLQACWYIPEKDDTAINGEWVEVPGREMLTELFSCFDHLPLIAEDLGVITDDVIRLKQDFNMPGMKVLQFAFDGNNANPHLPHRHDPGDVVYTGTHDNDTVLGWLKTESSYDEKYLEDYTNEYFVSVEERQLSIIRLAMASVSFLCIIPLQDLMMLDSASRMNVPGTMEGNWQWRFDWTSLRPDVLETVSHYMSLYQR